MGRAKAKLSVTVDARLGDALDRAARGASRSEIVERALAAWFREGKRRALDEATERYYRNRSAADRAEDEEWTAFVLRDLGERWK